MLKLEGTDMTLANPTQQNANRGYLRHRVTLEEFEALYVENPMFRERRFELLEGEIYEMTPAEGEQVGDEYINGLNGLNTELVLKLNTLAVIGNQIPVRLPETDTRPIPDFTIMPKSRYGRGVPTASQVSVVIEVSFSTLEQDRTLKSRLYAQSGLPEYWILNTQRNQLEVYREPDGEAYRVKMTLSVGEMVSPLEFPEVQIEWWV